MSASMSRNNNRNNRNNHLQTVKKPFCKVCFDSGKPEKLYASHCVRNPKYVNVVVCPTLLAQVCLTCGKKGHTSSRCANAQGEASANKKVVVKVCIEKKRAGAGTGTGTNGFAALMADDDEDKAWPMMTKSTSMSRQVVAAVPKNKSWVEMMDNETDDEEDEEDDDYDAYYKAEYYSDF